MGDMDKRYHSLAAGPSDSVARSGAWWQLILVVLLGLGSHFSKNAFAPAEPILHRLGLSPTLYAIITAAPVVGACIFPPFWGMACQRYQRTVLVMVPCGILVGQSILYVGLSCFSMEEGETNTMSEIILSVGLVTLSVFRAGGEVVQHTTLAGLLPQGLTRAFVALVVCTHLTVMMCNFVIPHEMAKGDGPGQMEGLLHVQFLLMLPSLAGVVAAVLLIIKCPCETFQQAEIDQNKRLQMATSGRFDRRLSDMSLTSEERRPSWTGHLLIIWAALTVGFLHSLQSITNGLVVSFGATAVVAGNVVGQCQMIALFALPVAGFLGDFIGRRTLVALTSILAFVACITLAVETVVSLPALAWQGSLMALAVSGVLGPVLSLALIPQNVPKVAMAYGMLDTLKSITQISLMLLFGYMREAQGWTQTAALACVPSAVAAVMAVVLAVNITDTRSNRCQCQFEGHSPRRGEV
eukprot:TRINITY_DN20310_c0_g1_i1.p1 TRINITY_DN20310_c0_g1~~TRINITY_DN20310_c0_g1_i1.p1  ORF type:complete len:466 (+),score=41.36 TRINITY_DN20310_c0_g1_i1:37-1434(+)